MTYSGFYLQNYLFALKTLNHFPLVANEGEWGFLLALYLYPPDKSGGYAKAILSGFSF